MDETKPLVTQSTSRMIEAGIISSAIDVASLMVEVSDSADDASDSEGVTL